jgi:hypothetical protein
LFEKIEMISRRLVLKSAAAALLPQTAFAENSCGPMGCTAQVPFLTFAAHYENQYQSEWCWAACISMVFGCYGHPIRQQRIVAEVYGAPYNIPAMSGLMIASALNKSWTDDNGESFDSVMRAAFDTQAGVSAINSAIIVDALENGDPLIVGSGGHATVLTEVIYVPTPAGPSILSAGVFDPWPGRGPRNLTQSEMTPVPYGSLTFLALANVT